MDIMNLMAGVEDIYNDPGFLTMIESHLTYLRRSPNVALLPVNEQQSYKYEGDYYGLLETLGITKDSHYIVMRVNNYASSADYKGTTQPVIVPDMLEVGMLKNVYLTGSDELA